MGHGLAEPCHERLLSQDRPTRKLAVRVVEVFGVKDLHTKLSEPSFDFSLE